MGISTFPAASAGGVTARNYKEQIFNASGTWTYPSSSNFDGTVEITCVGGGGAGGGIRNTAGQTISSITGAGGGGRVILNQKVNVLSAGNQTVTIGDGGVSNWDAGFGSSSGRYSIFGNPTIVNYYPDPNMRWGMFHNNNDTPLTYPESQYSSTLSLNHSWIVSKSIDSSLNTGYGAKTGGFGNGSAIGGVENDSITPYTGIFEVPASTEFKLMVYYTYYGAASATSCTPTVRWYNSSNVQISTSSSGSFTKLTSGTTFTLFTSGAFTSPATAKWARIIMQGGGGNGYNGLTLTPTSAGLTVPISGNTDGYQWGGSPDGSITVKTSTSNLANFVIAQGGGAGAGMGVYTTSNQLGGNAGLFGWSQGGYATYPSTNSALSTSEWMFGSNGGGAGGDATEPNYGMSYANTTNSNSMIENNGFQGWNNSFSGNYSYVGTIQAMDNVAFYGGGLASYPVKYATLSTHLPFINAGAGGPGIAGYGAGGNGNWGSGISGVGNNRGWNKGRGIKFRNSMSTQGGANYSKVDVQANTGNGGNGCSVFGSSTRGLEGQNGSSGLVIVRWYE